MLYFMFYECLRDQNDKKSNSEVRSQTNLLFIVSNLLAICLHL